MPSPGRILKSVLIIMGACLAILVILELGLRITGKGYDPAVLLKDATGSLRANPAFSQRILKPGTVVPLYYESAETMPPGKRILVIGDSSARGSHGASYNFAQILDRMLGEAYGISQLSFPVANSHVIRLLAESTAQQADLIIIYAGHYEYVGPFSGNPPLGDLHQTIQGARGHLAFQASRLRQLWQGLKQPDRGTVYSGTHSFRACQVSVRESDRERQQAMCRENFSAMARFLKQQGKHVILCVPGVNTRDAAPFNSNFSKNHTAEEQGQIVRLMQVGGYNYQAGKDQHAIELLTRALRMEERFAQPHFILAKIYEKQGQAGLARAHYERAVELDGIPLRADASIRKAIQRAAIDAGADLLDIHQVLAAGSTNQIPGSEWFHDHVHLNFQGHRAVAEALYERITGQESTTTNFPVMVQYTPSAQHEIERAFMDELLRPPLSYRYANNQQISRLRNPLLALSNLTARVTTTPLSRNQRLGRIDTMLTSETPRDASPEIETLLDENPYDIAARIRQSKLGRLTGQVKSPKHQIKLSRSYKQSPEALVELAETYAQLINPRDALKTYEKVLVMDQANIPAYRGAATALMEQGRYGEAIQGLSQALRHEPENPDVHEQAAELYERAKNFMMARQHIQRVLQIDPNRTSAQAIMQRLQSTGNETARKMNNEGSELMKTQRYAEALQRFKQAIDLYPDAPMAINNLAYLLATCPDETFRDGKQAVALATRLVSFAKDAPQPGFRATLAAAYAESGDFESAVETIIQAVEDAETLGQAEAAGEFLEIMGRYKEGEPYRHAPEGG
jgi:tetratricopeptide (TPR) repeat protein